MPSPMDTPIPVVVPTVAQITDAILDETTTDHVTANTVGQSISMLRNTAVAGTTTDSLFAKASAAKHAELATRTTSSENVTTTLAPATGDTTVLNAIYLESGAGNIATVEISPNRSNYYDRWALNNGTQIIGNDSVNYGIQFAIGASSHFRYTTPSDSGNYTVVLLGVTYST